jgi:hypothetical protein
VRFHIGVGSNRGTTYQRMVMEQFIFSLPPFGVPTRLAWREHNRHRGMGQSERPRFLTLAREIHDKGAKVLRRLEKGSTSYLNVESIYDLIQSMFQELDDYAKRKPTLELLATKRAVRELDSAIRDLKRHGSEDIALIVRIREDISNWMQTLEKNQMQRGK